MDTILIVPQRWLQPGSYAAIDLSRSGVVPASPFRRVPPPRVPFGRRVSAPSGRPPGIARRLAPYAGALAIAGAIDWLLKPAQPAHWFLPIGTPWYVALECHRPFEAYLLAAGTTDPGDPFGGCLFNQFSWDYDGTSIDWTFVNSSGQRTVIAAEKVDLGFPQRFNTAFKLSRQPGSDATADIVPEWVPAKPASFYLPPAPPGVDVPPGVFSEPDPNVWRRSRPASPPLYGDPGDWSEKGPPDPQVDIPHFRWEAVSGLRTGLGPGPSREPEAAREPRILIVPSVGSPTEPPQPPKEKEKEHKVRTKGKGAILLAWKILDGISEAGDAVKAMYDALPQKVRRAFEREERKRRGLKPGASLDRPGDQMGQYGINGADWRLRALWRYWDQLDPAQAVHNLITEEVTDRAYGRAFAARSRLQGRNLAGNFTGGHYRPRPI